MTAIKDNAGTGLPKGRQKPIPIPSVSAAEGGTRVSDLLEVDLSEIRKNSNADREQMQQRTASLALVKPAQEQVEMLSAIKAGTEDGVEHLRVGSTYKVALSLLQDSQFNARVYYSSEEIDAMALSLQNNGQDVSLAGYVDGSKVVVLDGSKRLRAARAASLDSLRVEIRNEPTSVKETYKASRRMNSERSPQTPLDDAVRFKALLEAGEYNDQTSLGEDMGVSQTVVSQTLSLNRIPQNVLRVMREESVHGKLCQLSFAIEVAKMFDGTHTEGQGQEDRAVEVIREIVAKDLSVKQTRDLVQSRLDGPKARQKAETTPVRYGSGLGTLKVFASKGQLDLSIKGVEQAKVEELRLKIEQLFAKQTG